MKAKWLVVAVASVIIATLFFVDMAYALTTCAEIHLTLRVVAVLSLDLENEPFLQNLAKPEGEAFSELRKSGLLVDKIRKGEATLWLVTKTE